MPNVTGVTWIVVRAQTAVYVTRTVRVYASPRRLSATQLRDDVSQARARADSSLALGLRGSVLDGRRTLTKSGSTDGTAREST